MYRVFQRPTDPSGSFRRGVARIRRAPLILMACVSMTACSAIGERLESFKGPNWPSSSSKANSSASAPAPQSSVQTAVHSAGPGHARPRIVTPKQWLQCVPYARQLTNVQLRGNAWTWWGQAKGRYQRGKVPAVGSVLVLKRKGRTRGHLAVVTQLISDREVIANHANWLNRGQIHLNTPIRDVSRNNDWSAVRVWYTPGNILGKSTYPAYGFIYPSRQSAAAR